MVRRYRPGCYTFASLFDVIPEDCKADVIDGVVYLSPPQTIEENDLVSWLCIALGTFVEELHLGLVTINKVAYRLDDANGPEPDVAFIRAQRGDVIRRAYVDGPPDLAVEIVSPESVDRDYELKRRLYERFGVGEYWIIDPDESTALFLILESGAYVEASLDGTIFHSRVLPGLTLDTRWLWQRPLPATLPIVRAMLAQA